MRHSRLPSLVVRECRAPAALIVLGQSERLARATAHDAVALFFAPIRIKIFEARIDVDVRAWDRLLFEARHMTPISQALTAPVALGGHRRSKRAGNAATKFADCDPWAGALADKGLRGPLPVWRQPMDIINLLIQLLSGAVGGNVAGNLARDGGLGPPGNTLAGAVGGGIGGQILSALLSLASARTAAGGLDLAGFVGQLLAGGLSGGILTAIVNMIRAAAAR